MPFSKLISSAATKEINIVLTESKEAVQRKIESASQDGSAKGPSLGFQNGLTSAVAYSLIYEV